MARFRLLYAGLIFEAMELENLDFSTVQQAKQETADEDQQAAASNATLEDDTIKELIGTCSDFHDIPHLILPDVITLL